MNVTTRDINLLIEFLRRNNVKATESHAMITKAFGEDIISLRRVQIIAKEFADGERVEFDRKKGSGQAPSDRRVELRDSAKEDILQNPHISLRELAAKYEVSYCMMRDIVVTDLDFQRMTCRWVPYTLTDQQKVNRVEGCRGILQCLALRTSRKNLIIIDEKQFFLRPIGCPTTRGCWVEPGGDVPQLARRSPMEKKFMALVAITFTGLCHVQVLQRNQTIDSNVYIQFLGATLAAFNSYELHQSRKAISPENCIIMHDNARPHASAATTAFLASRHIKTLKQPAYSPDVNMLDRMFFPKCEMKRKNRNLSSPVEVENFVRECASSNTVAVMDYEYEKLQDHCQLIINHGGEYVL
jgi:hypothetical protein